MVAAVGGAVLFGSGAAFWGLPSLLHAVSATAGGMEVTVVRAEPGSYRHDRCERVLVVAEFRSLRDGLCVPERLWRVARPGDELYVSGMVSAYGIQPEVIELTRG